MNSSLFLARFSHNLRASRLMAVLFLSTAVIACSSNKKSSEDLKPAELPEYQAEIGFKTLWKADIGQGQGKHFSRIAPAVVGDSLYIASVDGLVAKLEKATGKTVWQKQLDLNIGGGVSADHEQVIVGALNGDVVSLSIENGEERWRTRLTSEVTSQPTIDGNLVVVRCVDGHIYSLDLTTGEKLWGYNSTIPVLTLRGSGQVVFFNDLVIAGLANGKLVALDRATGVVRWENRVDIGQGRSEIERIVDIDATPLLLDDVVVGASYQGRMVAFNAESGRPMWQSTAPTYNNMSSGFGNIYVTNTQSQLMALSKHDGKVKWMQNGLKRRSLTAPSVVGSYIFASDYEGFLHVFSQVDGRLIGRKYIDRNGVKTAVTIADDQLYVYADVGTLYALKLTGDFEQFYSTGGTPARAEGIRKRGIHTTSQRQDNDLKESVKATDNE